jgi:hypothetical protein
MQLPVALTPISSNSKKEDSMSHQKVRLSVDCKRRTKDHEPNKETQKALKESTKEDIFETVEEFWNAMEINPHNSKFKTAKDKKNYTVD